MGLLLSNPVESVLQGTIFSR